MAPRKKSSKAEPAQLSFAEVETWEVPPVTGNCVEIGTLPSPIWTETKAQLIRNYLKLFLMITHHGAYIDGFAGPQDPANPESWAAKLVLELQPTWMNSFFFSELDPASYRALASMIESQPKVAGRLIQHKHADFNQYVREVLQSGRIKEKTAAFALLDQRATECDWATVRKLAAHKTEGNKIELFYFFPTGWVHRSVSETRDKSKLERWWGDDTWQKIPNLRQDQAATLCLSRIQALGYNDAKSWPISSREGGEGRTMYHMIHATDHTAAPQLMYRAYRQLIGVAPGGEQTEMAI
jgi:three-Cys-motif partner protein